jgi:uncharacterized protein YbjT (DUF2867 family)
VSGTIWVIGGDPALADAVTEAAAERPVRRLDLEAGEEVRPGDAVIDLGLAPDEVPPGDALPAAERSRCEALVSRVPAGVRIVRGSVLGAAADAPASLQRASAAAEEALASAGHDVVRLRTGILLGSGGLVGALRGTIERSPVIPFPAIGRVKFEPLAAEDLARYCIEAATAAGPLDPVYDLGCGEILTAGLLVKGLAENLGLRRWIVPVPGMPVSAFAPLYATSEFPRPAVAHWLETLRRGLLPRRVNAWKHFSVEPIELRFALAQATGMMIPLRKRGEGRFAAWKKPEKKGILWTKRKERR